MATRKNTGKGMVVDNQNMDNQTFENQTSEDMDTETMQELDNEGPQTEDCFERTIKVRKDKNSKAIEFTLRMAWQGFDEKLLKSWAARGLVIRLQECLRKEEAAYLQSLAGKVFEKSALDIANMSTEQPRLSRTEIENNAKTDMLDKLLSAGMITEDQHKEAVAKLLTTLA